MIEQEHVLEVLEQARKAVGEEDTIKLKELSNGTIHSASIYEDTDNITIAVIIYSLSKIIERTRYKEYPSWKSFIKALMSHLDRAIKALKEKDELNFVQELKKIRKEISSLTGDFKKNVQDVFQKASINKASKIYEHGISMAQTAKMLGISLWDLADYAGQTGVADVNLSVTMDIKKRIKIAEDLFS